MTPAQHRRRGSTLARIADLVVTHPKPVLAIWLGIIAVLGVLGLGLESKLSTVAVYVPGTPSGQAEQLKILAFGNQDPLVVMLRGPAREADRQGRLLARN